MSDPTDNGPCSNCGQPAEWLPYVGGDDDPHRAHKPVDDEYHWADAGCTRPAAKPSRRHCEECGRPYQGHARGWCEKCGTEHDFNVKPSESEQVKK